MAVIFDYRNIKHASAGTLAERLVTLKAKIETFFVKLFPKCVVTVLLNGL